MNPLCQPPAKTGWPVVGAFRYIIDAIYYVLCFFRQKTAYEMRISDWSSDVCSSDLRKRFVDAYWIAETPDVLLRNAQLVADADAAGKSFNIATHVDPDRGEIGRASCRERVCQYVWISVVAGSLKKKTTYLSTTYFTTSHHTNSHTIAQAA